MIWYVSVPDRDTSPTGPCVQISPGMMPTLALPGEISPGQFGPINVTDRSLLRMYGTARAISIAGMFSVIATMTSTPAS